MKVDDKVVDKSALKEDFRGIFFAVYPLQFLRVPGDPYTFSDHVYSDVSKMFAIMERYGTRFDEG